MVVFIARCVDEATLDSLLVQHRFIICAATVEFKTLFRHALGHTIVNEDTFHETTPEEINICQDY